VKSKEGKTRDYTFRTRSQQNKI